MGETIKQINLRSTANGSDKIYILTLEKVEGGYIVSYTHGKREVGPFQSGFKTVDPADRKKAKPVSLEEAEKIFAQVEKEKRTGKSKYHEDEDETTPTQKPSSTDGARTDVTCMELTAIMDAPTAVRFLRNPEFAAEEKHDGIRLLLHATPEKVTSYNRSGGARAFPAVIEREALQLAQAFGSFLLDGELVGERYHAFDILEQDGISYHKHTYDERKILLLNLFEMAGAKAKTISMVETAFTEADKIKMLETLTAQQREGIVFKKLSSRYTAGRSKEWLKFKFVATASVLVTKHNEKRSVTMSLLHKGALREVGHLPIPTNKEIPIIGSIVEVRYRKADPNSLNLIESVFLSVRDDVTREDCTTTQLKFTTKAA